MSHTLGVIVFYVFSVLSDRSVTFHSTLQFFAVKLAYCTNKMKSLLFRELIFLYLNAILWRGKERHTEREGIGALILYGQFNVISKLNCNLNKCVKFKWNQTKYTPYVLSRSHQTQTTKSNSKFNVNGYKYIQKLNVVGNCSNGTHFIRSPQTNTTLSPQCVHKRAYIYLKWQE